MAVIVMVVGSIFSLPALADERIVTEAEAFVDEDGHRDFDHVFEVHDLDSPVVDPANLASAHARGCTRCQAVALSFQVVLVQGVAEVVEPENVAVSLNEECSRCDAAAGAYQFVVGRGEPIRLTSTGRRELAQVRVEVARLQTARLSGPVIVARADELADRVRAILESHVEPVAGQAQVVIDDRRFHSIDSGPSQQTSTTVLAAA